MVYKKIGNTIPSLSSLLLAGVLFAGCQDGEGAGNKAKEPAMGDNEEIVKGNNLGPQQGIPVHNNRLLSDAVVAIRDKIIEYAGLSPLKEDAKYMVVPPDQFNTDTQAEFIEVFKGVLKRFSSSDLDAFYPSEMKEDRAAWGALAGYLDKIQKPFAVANAFNHFINLYKGMSKALSLMQNYDKKGLGLQEYEKLRAEHISPILSQLVEFNDDYIGKKKFENNLEGTGKIAWLEGERWVRFMKDVDKNGNPKTDGHKYGMPDLLKKQFSIWIKNHHKDAVKYHDDPFNNLDKRDVGINEAWKIDRMTMPKIEQLHNDRLVRKFHLAPLHGAEDSGYDGIDLTGEAIFPLVDNTAHVLSANPAVLSDYEDETRSQGGSCKLTFATLSYVLFNDYADKDSRPSNLGFITIKPGKKNGKVIVNLDQTRFERLLDFCGDDKKFAQALGRHIEDTSLKDLIIVPDYKELCGKLSLDRCAAIPSLNDVKCEPSNINDVGGTVKITNKDAPLYILCEKIYQGLGLDVPTNIDLVFESLGKISKIEDNRLYNRSDVTFEQRAYIGLAKKLFEYKEKWISKISTEYATRESLESFVHDYLKDLCKSALIFKDLSGEYESTSASSQLRVCLREWRGKLVQKRNNSMINYEKILEDFQNKQTTAGVRNPLKFDLKNMCTVTRQYFVKVLDISKLDIANAVSSEKKIEKSDFKDASWILPQVYDEINKIKDDYKDKVTKSSANSGRAL